MAKILNSAVYWTLPKAPNFVNFHRRSQGVGCIPVYLQIVRTNGRTTVFIINTDEANVGLLGMYHRLPVGYQKGWDYIKVNEEFIGSNADLFQLNVSFNGWGDEELSEDNVTIEFGEADYVATEPCNAPAPVVRHYLTSDEEFVHVRDFLRNVR